MGGGAVGNKVSKAWGLLYPKERGEMSLHWQFRWLCIRHDLDPVTGGGGARALAGDRF